MASVASVNSSGCQPIDFLVRFLMSLSLRPVPGAEYGRLRPTAIQAKVDLDHTQGVWPVRPNALTPQLVTLKPLPTQGTGKEGVLDQRMRMPLRTEGDEA